MPHLAIQFPRGTTAQHASFTGLLAQLTVDTTKNTVVVHDGTTAGGHPLSKEGHTHANTDITGLKYQTINSNGTGVNQRSEVNFSTEFTLTDDPGNDQTTVALANSGASAGSYGNAASVPSITVDAKGRITSVSNVSITYPSQIPTQGGNAGKYLKTNGTGTSWDTPVVAPAYASILPAEASNVGQLSLPGTGYSIRRSNGTTNEKFGPMTKMVHPNFGSFSWINQGANATVADQLGSIEMDAGTEEATQNIRAMVMSLSSAPWKITAAFYPFIVPGASGAEVGILLRDSGTSQIVTFSVGFSSGALIPNLRKFTNETTADSNYTITNGYALPAGGLVWLQIEDTGANRVSRVSMNGVHFMDVHSVTNSDFLAARNQTGFFVDCRGSSKRCGMSLVSFVIE